MVTEDFAFPPNITFLEELFPAKSEQEVKIDAGIDSVDKKVLLQYNLWVSWKGATRLPSVNESSSTMISASHILKLTH